jgi:hypothetical protein
MAEADELVERAAHFQKLSAGASEVARKAYEVAIELDKLPRRYGARYVFPTLEHVALLQLQATEAARLARDEAACARYALACTQEAWDALSNGGALIAAGCRASDDEGSSLCWAVYDRERVRELGFDDTSAELAQELTGWQYEYRGAGRAFAAEPYTRNAGRFIFVTQYRGLDI